jgi:acyl-CoA thioester hydrolase
LYKHETELRVRYEETDQMGVVYYSNCLVWFEVGRAEYIRSLGTSYKELERHGVHIVVAEAYCKYEFAARYDDIIIIRTSLSEIRSRSMKYTYKVLRKADRKLLASGYTTHVFVDRNGKPMKIPKWVLDYIMKKN